MLLYLVPKQLLFNISKKLLLGTKVSAGYKEGIFELNLAMKL